MAISRVQANPFWYHPITGKQTKSKTSKDCVYFASSFEFRIFLIIQSSLGKNWNIERQVPILYKPATTNYNSLLWKVDFSIFPQSNPDNRYFVEAKGDWIYEDKSALGELQHKIQFLEFIQPSIWQRLVIVGDKKPKILNNVLSFDTKEFQLWLKDLSRTR